MKESEKEEQEAIWHDGIFSSCSHLVLVFVLDGIRSYSLSWQVLEINQKVQSSRINPTGLILGNALNPSVVESSSFYTCEALLPFIPVASASASASQKAEVRS